METTFVVFRTSDWYGEKKPCEEAIQKGEDWFVTLKDMDELLSFIRKYGHCVVSNYKGNELPCIEIYDYYRE